MQNTGKQKIGTLFVVATPIGNLSDITLRAIDTLRSVDMIACEDTRTSRVLLDAYGIKKNLVSFHKFSAQQRVTELIDALSQGMNIAYITDAGTPGISDPGAFLVATAREHGIGIVPLPGASALTAAVAVSGTCDHGFIFLGFMPEAVRQRKMLVQKYFTAGLPVVFYESPRRLLQTLLGIRQIIGNVSICVCKELTKLYEHSMSGRIDDVVDQLGKNVIRGEYTVIVNISETKEKHPDAITDKKSLLEAASRVTGLSKRDLYKKLFTKE